MDLDGKGLSELVIRMGVAAHRTADELVAARRIFSPIVRKRLSARRTG